MSVSVQLVRFLLLVCGDDLGVLIVIVALFVTSMPFPGFWLALGREGKEKKGRRTKPCWCTMLCIAVCCMYRCIDVSMLRFVKIKTRPTFILASASFLALPSSASLILSQPQQQPQTNVLTNVRSYANEWNVMCSAVPSAFVIHDRERENERKEGRMKEKQICERVKCA